MPNYIFSLHFECVNARFNFTQWMLILHLEQTETNFELSRDFLEGVVIAIVKYDSKWSLVYLMWKFTI